MPNALQWLLQRLVKLVQTATTTLEQSYPDGAQAWQDEIARQLARYHAAALMAGANVDTLTPEMRVKVTADLAAQLRYRDASRVEGYIDRARAATAAYLESTVSS